MSVISEITVQTLTPYKQIIRYKQVSSQEGLCDTKEYSTVQYMDMRERNIVVIKGDRVCKVKYSLTKTICRLKNVTKITCQLYVFIIILTALRFYH